MVFGGLEQELIQLNDDTLWSGTPGQRQKAKPFNSLESVRKLINEGQYEEADKRIKQEVLSDYTQSYLPLGDLRIKRQGQGQIEKYQRQLSLQDALCTLQYTQGGAEFKQTAFCSAPAQAMIVHMKTEEGINFSASLDSLLRHSVERLADNHLVLRGKCPSQVDPNYHTLEAEPIIYDERPTIEFELHLFIRTEGGSASINDDMEILVNGAHEATLFIVTATTYPEVMDSDRYSSMRELCLGRIQAANKLSYEELVERHIVDYRQLYDRVELTLDTADFTYLPTDQRLLLLKEGSEDRGLVELFFHYGRYLLIASSRPGTQPANLQGIWNREIRPPWSSNYTTNINAEMNYWPVEVCNLSECHEPLFTLLETLGRTGSEMAAVAFGSRGWAANHNTDIWGLANPVGKGEGSVFWAFWPMAGVWLSQHLWEHYQFTKDEAFLRSRAYPLMKGAALFCIDWLVEDESGYLVTNPSTSPENIFIAPDGQLGTVSKATTMDMSLIRDLFYNCMEAGKILDDLDHDFLSELQQAYERLFPLQIGKLGQLQEWFADFEEREPGHRHLSHLFGLYPGREILLHEHPELANAVRTSLERRLNSGGGHTGWSCAWIINLFARLEDAESAYRYVQQLLQKSTYPNLFDAHPPFQIDGNFGGIAGIAEMLLQSHANEINLLPALPVAWANGEIRGLVARGGFEVSLRWEQGKLVEGTIYSKHGGNCIVRSKTGLIIQAAESVEAEQFQVQALGLNHYQFATSANGIYKLRSQTLPLF
jgi:alpha-L-fucosidase 2